MRHRANSPRTDGLLPLGVADALWVDVLADSAIPPASSAFTGYPTHTRAGYVLLGGRAVPIVRASGRWHVSEADVRQSAAELRAVKVNGEDLVRVAPFRRSVERDQKDWLALRWRRQISWEWDRLHHGDDRQRPQQGRDHLQHLVGIDWRRMLPEHARGETTESWWLPRALVDLLDAAERTEEKWLRIACTCQGCGAVARQSYQWRVQRRTGWQTICPDCRASTLRPYAGELEGQLYSAVSKKPRTAEEVSRWMCAVCQEAPAFALDHCHEHDYVRAPVCQSCNVRERPKHIYSDDVIVSSSYSDLLTGGAQHWLTHWHRCPGCRARNTLPLPHLAALTALLVAEKQRPTHRDPYSSRGRKPCGELRASWSGSHKEPGSCTITVFLDYCPTGEHRALAQVPYREAADRFRAWLTDTAPDVAAAAGPGRHDTIPAQFRPVVADTNGDDLALF